MKKTLLSLFVAFGFIGYTAAQNETIIFEDDFESYDNFTYTDVGDWTLLNENPNGSVGTYSIQDVFFPNQNEPHAFIVFNSTGLGLGDGWDARSGEKAMLSFADIEGPNDSWLISPKITLGVANNSVSFYAKATAPNYGDEEFNVLVSVGSTDPSDFEEIGYHFITTGSQWVEYNYDLDEYADQDVHIAIQCISDDQFGFMVDDFKVEGDVTASVDDFTAAQFKIHPNPATDIININNLSELVISEINLIDVQGRVLQRIINDNLNQTQINVSTLSSGLYFLDIQTDAGKVVKKFSKR